jgi:hypothetical protein
MSRLKEIAKTFGMSVTEFASFTGYSKQALYQMIDGDNGVCTPRLKATIDHLKFASESLHSQDIVEARIQKNNRDKAIKELEQFIGIPEVEEYDFKRCMV